MKLRVKLDVVGALSGQACTGGYAPQVSSGSATTRTLQAALISPDSGWRIMGFVL